jgi:hypothetical protein
MHARRAEQLRSAQLVDEAREHNQPGNQHNRQQPDALQVRADVRVVGSNVLAL